GILAYVAGRLLTRPLERLEDIASQAAKGHLKQEIDIPQSDDAVRSLSIAVDTMLKTLMGMVHNIDKHFKYTNDSVVYMKEVSETAAQHSAQISASTDDISKGAESSAEAIQQTAEAVEEATRLAEEVQTKANQSTEKSEYMLQTLDHSKKVVNQLVDRKSTRLNSSHVSISYAV